MSLTITNDEISSDQTPHTARRLVGHEHLFVVSWMPLHPVGRNAAITAIGLAELVAEPHQETSYLQRLRINDAARELGISPERAIEMISEPPDQCE